MREFDKINVRFSHWESNLEKTLAHRPQVMLVETGWVPIGAQGFPEAQCKKVRRLPNFAAKQQLLRKVHGGRGWESQ